MKKVLLVALVSLSTLVACGGKSSEAKVDTIVVSEQPVVEGIKRTILAGVGGSCEMCKERIENVAKGMDGVELATWNAESKSLELTSSKSLDVDAISKALAAAGHDTGMHKTDDAVYNALPGCCHYRK